MPTIVLKNRRPNLKERMDQDDCDLTKLFNTYDQFWYVNRVISGWGRIYRRWLRPRLVNRPSSILDIGCGGGDLIKRLAVLARKDGIDVQITGIEPDERAVAYLQQQKLPSNVIIRNVTSADLVSEGRNYDIVVSNHVLHHLHAGELNTFIRDSESLASSLAIHSDIRRDDLAYLGFLPTYALFRNSFITIDGLTSIRRSYLPSELASILPQEWRVLPMALFRNLIVWEP